MKCVPQLCDASSQQTSSPLDGLHRLEDRYPPRLFAEHLMEIFSVKSSRFYQLQAAGKFDRFELRPVIGRRAWCRDLVQKYLDSVPGASRFVDRKPSLRGVNTRTA